MSNIVKRTANKIINGPLGLAGFRLSRISRDSPHVRVAQLLGNLGITTVIDVGANAGQYAMELRKNKFAGRIISFEPQRAAFQTLQSKAQADVKWTVINAALGDSEGKCDLNISRNSVSSSLLKALPEILKFEPGIEPVALESVRVSTLDNFWHTEQLESETIFLKLDVQGYEMAVLRGAKKLLPRCKGIQVEMALAPSYSGQNLIGDTITVMYQAGFRLVLILEGFREKESGYLIEVDGIFVPVESGQSSSIEEIA